MPHFNPPFTPRPGFLCLTYDLSVRPPLPKPLAIQLLYTVLKFAVLLRPYATGVYHEARIISRVVLAAESPGSTRRTSSSEAVTVVIQKWADQEAREGELEKWDTAAAQMIARLEKVIAGVDTPVVEVAATRCVCVGRSRRR